MSKALTDAFLRNLKPPPTGRLELADPACRGLRFRVTSNDERSFSFRYGRGERMPIGSYPDVRLRDARARADALRGEVAAGRDPAAHKRGTAERTFAHLAERYVEEHAKRKKRSWDADVQALKKHVLPYWADRDYKTLKRADVIELVERIVKAGTPIAANRVQALVSKVFSFALDAALLEAHPALRLSKRGKETAKKRKLSDDEIRLFWQRAVVTPAVGRATGLALRLLLVLGCRADEVAGMTRREFEFDREGTPVSWTLPAERAKNERALYVPLPPLAVELLTEALALAGEGTDAVFPSRTNGGEPIAGHALTVAMRRLAVELPDDMPGADTWHADVPTCHDLRRTAATRTRATGVAGEHVSAILNHITGGVTRKHYDLYDLAPEKAEAWRRWSFALSAVLRGQEPNVVTLRR